LTSIKAVSIYLPPVSVPVSEYLQDHGLTDARIKIHERYYGFGQIRLDPNASLANHLSAAAAKLDALPGQNHHVRYVIQARTMPVVSPYPVNPLHEVSQSLGLTHATTFCVTQHACASGLLAVNLAGKLLAADGHPDALALVLTGEKAFTSCAQVIADTGVMGEGTAALLVRFGGDRDRVLSYATHTRGEFSGGAWMSPELSQTFQQDYPVALADVMLAAVAKAGLRIDDIDLVLPHNVNRMSWMRVLKRLGIRGTDRLFLDNLPLTGHCFGADSFINYQTARDRGRLRPGDRYLMTAVGLGATFSAMVLQH
jgi:3-oxoacyl-[acyl-carrier-protein] synthase-3